MTIGMPCTRMTTKRRSAVNVARTLTPVATLVPWSKAMRAPRWFAAKAHPTPIRMTMPSVGDILASMRVRNVSLLAIALAAVSLGASACEYPDEGTMPVCRAVTGVKLLPETETWAAAQHKAGAMVQYALYLDREWHRQGRCYWTVEARAQGTTWRRFYVSPDGKSVLNGDGRTTAAAR